MKDRGSTSVAAVLMVVIGIAGGGLLVNGGSYLVAQRQASNLSEAGARAAVATAEPGIGLTPSLATPAATSIVDSGGGTVTSISYPDGNNVLVTVSIKSSGWFGFAATATATGSAEVIFQ